MSFHIYLPKVRKIRQGRLEQSKKVRLCYKEGDQNLFSTHFTYYRISQPISSKMIDKLYFEYRSIGYMILDSM